MKHALKYITLIGVLMMTTSPALAEQSAYDFTFEKLLADEPLPLSDFKGQVALVVNTASECGFTGQYEGLEVLYQEYKAQGLVVLGVPSNDFGGQEPGSAKDIAEFCQLNYGVSFPMANKTVVKGDDAHPFYVWAREALGFGTAPKWNFHKYLINRKGALVDYFHSTTKPSAPRLKKAIEAALVEAE